MIAKLREAILNRWMQFDFDPAKSNDISVIERSSTWLGASGKVVFLLFRRGGRIPFAVAKIVRDERYKHTLQKEFDHLSQLEQQTSETTVGSRCFPIMFRTKRNSQFSIRLRKKEFIIRKWGD